MKKIKRFTILFLLLTLVCACFIGCNGGNTDKSSGAQQGESVENNGGSESDGNGGSEIIWYDVVFDSNGGISVDSQKVEQGGKVVKPNKFTNTKVVREENVETTYSFKGWYYGDVKWDFENNSVDNPIELKAEWEFVKRELLSIK